MTELRVGQGWDRHRLVEGESLVLGGVEVSHSSGTVGHSDGDPLIHATIDALLGAAALGDIGQHYPSSDDRWQGASSLDLLSDTMDKIIQAGLEPVNIDTTIIIEQPPLADYRDQMCTQITSVLASQPPINIKFKTADGTGPIGHGDVVEAKAVVLLKPRP